MAVKGKVIYVGPDNGRGVRVGARSPDGLTWWWTQKGKAPRKGEIVVVPQGAKPEPGRRLPEEPARENEIARAVALKAAATVYAGAKAKPEEILALAGTFERWFRRS
ncbi:hypothetical protein J7L84_00610 [Candidatus Bipolaricaulota bacterium]|nr:hypothetical protein [Candidatus Bipolaricaulota bacterium]